MARKQTRRSISMNHEIHTRAVAFADAFGAPAAKLVEIGLEIVMAMPFDELEVLHREHQQRMDARLGVWRVVPPGKRKEVLGQGEVGDQHPLRPGRPPARKLTAAEMAMAKERAAREMRALELRATNKSMSAIATTLGVSRQRIYQILGRITTPLEAAAEVQRRRERNAVTMEAATAAEVKSKRHTGRCCPHPVERHAYNGCADCGCGVLWTEHPDRDLDVTPSAVAARRAAP